MANRLIGRAAMMMLPMRKGPRPPAHCHPPLLVDRNRKFDTILDRPLATQPTAATVYVGVKGSVGGGEVANVDDGWLLSWSSTR